MDHSAHKAPTASVAACPSVWHLRHLEYVHDHVRIARILFAGGPEPEWGAPKPNLDRSGLGLQLKRADAERFAA